MPNPSIARVPSQRGAGAMLAQLVTLADSAGDATTILHERVVLHRLDGTSLRGRAAVVDAVSTRGSEASLTVVGGYAESIHVAMVIEGVPGRLVFMMSADVEDGQLVEIWME